MLSDQERFSLYDAAVVSPAFEVEFYEQAFADAFSTSPRHLREDFCGTAAISRSFVQSHPQRRAIGVDLDSAVLAFAQSQCPPEFGDRLKLIESDVCDVALDDTVRPDIVSAQNFSWCGFHRREQLLDYFRRCLAALNPQGLLVVDLMGGAEREVAGSCDRRDVGPCVVSFRQETFDPIGRRARFHLDFTLRGETTRAAFTYDWRLWTVPETVDLMREAGFDSARVYWEKRDAFGAPTSRFSAVERAAGLARYVCYIVGVKTKA